MNGIIVKGHVLRLVADTTNSKEIVCYKCALNMEACMGLCAHFGKALGYTRKDTNRMYFVR